MILEVRNVSKVFHSGGGFFSSALTKVKALDRVSFCLEKGSTLGIVGESGCGKTTLARIIMGLIEPTEGAVSFDSDIVGDMRKDCQMIFQDPYNSLDPRMRISDALSEPMMIHGICGRSQLRDRVAHMLDKVGLNPDCMYRYPREFSGGQRQRICIARALAAEPKFLVLDEPLSSLDLTIQSTLLDLFLSLKREFALTYLFISHNLAVIRHISDHVAVMRSGSVVESGTAEKIFSAPDHEYTRSLIAAAS